MNIRTITAQIDQYKTSSLTQANKAKPSPPEGQAESAADTISLSNKGKLLQTAQETANASPGIREDKVEILKDQVASGTYTTDAGNIARNMLQEELDIMG
ncbi:flagellar biosynthesis anti-sigma factor FlgM [Desulfoplanes formicivorans]|uniref:Negative regulator of flagellin synthesis n=1 Tax=Desulfoplanes formicivorans TaxID=1592317 RepID=A0A194AJY6_9BACT|nr:flagellar biosynthesis anti-sigma factor FlgM [Desulfoplanes formicivorans]GAU09628.1 flagellar biosynthesis anti-sigma factor FlgM [Desulfoplanes formicivorans]